MAQYRMTQGLAFKKLEKIMREMQRKEEGVPIRCQKLFLTSIPSVFTGFDLIEWLMERFLVPDEEAVHMANMVCQLGYFFPVPITASFTVKDDGGLYRFQAPFYWPSYNNTPDNTDYAVYLVKLLQSGGGGGSGHRKCVLEQHEHDIYCKLRQTLSHKWELIIITAENQVRMQRQRKKIDKVISESQERAFWRIHRPPSGMSAMLERGPRKCYQENRKLSLGCVRALKHQLETRCVRIRNTNPATYSKCEAQVYAKAVKYAAHSHNDYTEQSPPLWRAVSLGIGSVEADLHLVDGTLFIGHDRPSNVTVRELYLDPLKEKINKDGHVWPWNSTQPLNVLFDLKTDAIPTYDTLVGLIKREYSHIFSYRVSADK